MVISQAESRAIEWLRFAMAFAVVLLHTGSPGCDSFYPLYSSLCILFPNGICRIAVPLFFLISGYLFFNSFEQWGITVYFSKIKKRVYTILLPYLLWNILAFFILYFYGYFRTKLHGDIPLSISTVWSNWKGFRLFWDSNGGLPIDYPLWFIRDLFIIILISPLIYYNIKKLRYYGMLCLFAVYIVFGRFFMGLFFFSLGGWLMINGLSLTSIARKYKWASVSTSLLLLSLIIPAYKWNQSAYWIIERIFTLPGTFAIICLSSEGIRSGLFRFNGLLSRSSFFIYASHAIIILHDIAHYIVLHFLPVHGELYYCLDLLLRPIITVCICVAIYWSMEKVCPRLLCILTGGRLKQQSFAT